MAQILKPLANRVIVKRLPAQAKSEGGIIIPDDSQEAPNRGTIISVGTGTKDDPMMVAPGETALFGKYAGTEIEHNGETLLILNQTDIMATLSDEPTAANNPA